jgi:hypothetical protein
MRETQVFSYLEGISRRTNLGERIGYACRQLLRVYLVVSFLFQFFNIFPIFLRFFLYLPCIFYKSHDLKSHDPTLCKLDD